MKGIPCKECGLFMSYDDLREGVTYVPYGTVLDVEPPPEEHIHKKCWYEMEPIQRDALRNAVWQMQEPEYDSYKETP